MRYSEQTFAYLKKNLWLPIIAMLLPSAVACFLSTPYWEVAFVAGFDYQPFRSAGETFTLLFGDSWQYLWPAVVIGIVQIFGASLIMSAIDRHFRTGKMSLKSPWRLINYSLFPLAISVVIMSVLSIVWRFLLFGLVSLVQTITHALAFSAGASLAVISAVAVGLFVLHVLMIMPMLFWAPTMFIYGYKFRDAAAASLKLIAGKKLFLGLLLPMAVCAGLQLLLGFLQVHAAISYSVGFVVFLFTNVYATVYTIITFYSISELDRRDIKPYENYVMPRPAAQPPKPEPSAQQDDSADNAVKPTKTSKQSKSNKTSKTSRSSKTTKTVKPTKTANAGTPQDPIKPEIDAATDVDSASELIVAQAAIQKKKEPSDVV